MLTKKITIEAYANDYKMSRYFTYGEMIKSQTAIRKNINNLPNEIQFKNLQILCENVLDVVRIGLKSPVIIGSGLRVPELNTIIGGSKNSQHRLGEAADFDVIGYNTQEVFEWIILKSSIIWDQVISEFPNSPNGGWVHISHTTHRNNRMKITTAKKVNSRTIYEHLTKEQIRHGMYEV